MDFITNLEGRDNVALDSVSDSLVDTIKLEVSSKRIESHRATDDSRVVTHS
jgi:hypothetical protein